MDSSEHSSCTTILVGKNASYDGSTLIARNEDAGVAVNPKKFVVMHPADQPRNYHAKGSQFAIQLPNNPQRYTAVPEAVDQNGVWGEAGINGNNVAMSATETITTNSRVLGADPLTKSGVGEEDLLTVTLPYINSAREGVQRVAQILKEHGTYESNGIIFSDVNEIWYMETAGGHHWVAQRIPDNAYVIAPNQTGIQEVDFNDPDNFMFPDDLRDFVKTNHLNPANDFNFRKIFGSNSQLDHHYNTPRAWYGQRYFNPESVQGKSPMSNNLPFICHADRKITIEDIKFVLSSHYQDTPYDPFAPGVDYEKTPYRPIGFNRNQELSIMQLRPYVAKSSAAIQWLAFAANPYNILVPFFTNIDETPAAYGNTTGLLDSHNAYWLNRLISLIATDHYHSLMDQVEAYQEKEMGYGHQRVAEIDKLAAKTSQAGLIKVLTGENAKTADTVMKDTQKLLTKLVAQASNRVRGSFTRAHY